jgi:hypothetical protein
MRGNEVRVVEERQNQAFTRTLRQVGAGPARHFHDTFRAIQHHTYEPRTGAPLLEWVTREIALIDVAVAVEGLGRELCRWLANVSRDGIVRAYLTFDPDGLTNDTAAALELDKLDLVLAPSRPAATLRWKAVPLAIAEADRAAGLLPNAPQDADAIVAAERFEVAVAQTPASPAR